MYPIIRMAHQVLRARKKPPLGLFETDVITLRCWPWDLDIFFELNNGRTLTLYDLGRVPLGVRTGLFRYLKASKQGMTVAGSAVRYRRRIKNMQRFEMRSRLMGWDERFFYFDQTMWLSPENCAGQAILRMAITGKDGIVNPQAVIDDLWPGAEKRELPQWVQDWSAAEHSRPWPPPHS